MNIQKVGNELIINSRNVLLPAEFLVSPHQKFAKVLLYVNFRNLCKIQSMFCYHRVHIIPLHARIRCYTVGLSALRTRRNRIRCTILQERKRIS